MGLDMYLTAKRYMADWVDDSDAEKQTAIQILFPELANLPRRYAEGSPVKEVCVEAGYWRKANAIHDWFVKNVQDGEDECQPHYVSREHLEQLRSLCEQVWADPSRAEQLLPTAKGFFFGDTSYDENYLDDLRHTVDIIDRCLTLPDTWSFEYLSSW